MAEQPPAEYNQAALATNTYPKPVSEYMASIGAKGGSANPAGTKKRSDQARAAVNARWEKFRKENPGEGKGKK